MDSFNHFGNISETLLNGLKQVVRKTAFDVVGNYQANAARDTGFMANSAYAVTSQESTYGQGGGPTRKDAYLLPEVAAPSDDYTAYAAVGADYAIYPELGTRFQAAQPAFFPAVDKARPGFEQAIDAIESQLQ